MKRSSIPVSQKGVMLLEALVAILIFSIGVLAIVGLQATAIKEAGDARYRTDAAQLANQLVGQMWVVGRGTGLAGFATGGASYNTWLTDVSAALPGVTGNPPTVTLGASGLATIVVKWKAPSEASSASAHTYTVVVQVQ